MKFSNFFRLLSRRSQTISGRNKLCGSRNWHCHKRWLIYLEDSKPTIEWVTGEWGVSPTLSIFVSLDSTWSGPKAPTHGALSVKLWNEICLRKNVDMVWQTNVGGCNDNLDQRTTTMMWQFRRTQLKFIHSTRTKLTNQLLDNDGWLHIDSKPTKLIVAICLEMEWTIQLFSIGNNLDVREHDVRNILNYNFCVLRTDWMQ